MFFFRYKTLPRVAGLWPDTNIVTTLSKYYSPVICEEGSGVRQTRKVNKVRRRRKSGARSRTVITLCSSIGSTKEMQRRLYLISMGRVRNVTGLINVSGVCSIYAI